MIRVMLVLSLSCAQLDAMKNKEEMKVVQNPLMLSLQSKSKSFGALNKSSNNVHVSLKKSQGPLSAIAIDAEREESPRLSLKKTQSEGVYSALDIKCMAMALWMQPSDDWVREHAQEPRGYLTAIADTLVGEQGTIVQPLLFIFAREAKVAAVYTLLQAGANGCAQAADGQTLLHILATHGCIKDAKKEIVRQCVQLCAESNCNVDAINGDGDTPAHCAMRAGNVGVVELLRSYKADFTIKNKKQQTPRDVLDTMVEEIGIQRGKPIILKQQIKDLQKRRANGENNQPEDEYQKGLKILKKEYKELSCLVHNKGYAQLQALFPAQE